MKTDISIVIPVYNTEKGLVELHRQIVQAVQHLNYELILVNDKSPDKSWERIVDISKIDSRVKGISLKKNSGQDNAIMAGLGFATGDYVVVMDDDLQHSPSDIVKLLHACSDGSHDIRYGLFSRKKQSLWKNIGSKLNEHV